MKNTDLNQKTTAQLQLILKTNKAIALILLVALLFFMALAIYGLVTKENISAFIAFFAVVCSCWSILPLQIGMVKKIKAELKSRCPSVE
ncbi:MAG: hypothetical protein AAGB24_13240 [Bacteroidota bacterium]